MKPLRKNVAISIDGGGIRGVIVARALARLEKHLNKSVHEIFRLAVGTSTGSIISAGIGVGITAEQMHRLYIELGGLVFRKSLRSYLWPIFRYRYHNKRLEAALKELIGEVMMGDIWSADPPTDVVITVFDLVENRTRFVKTWKDGYKDWAVVKAVLASSSIPTYFPVVDGRYIDGGVGSYANPCYMAAYELHYCLNWDPSETTLISLGTGRDPNILQVGDADKFRSWQWIKPVLGAFLQSADDQQVRLVDTFFQDLDFRRFQVDLREPIETDDPQSIPELTKYGDELWEKINSDQIDKAIEVQAGRIGLKA